MKDIQYLYLIKDKIITSVRQEISNTIPINDTKQEGILTEFPLVLNTEAYSLFIYNKWSITGVGPNIQDLIGLAIIDTYSRDQYLVFQLSDAISIIIDISDEGYNGPESLVLKGPNDFFVVWS